MAEEGPSLLVTPPSATIAVGDSTRFVVTLIGSNDRRAVWVTSTPALATVDSMGWVRAKAVGTVIITATSAVEVNAKTSALVTVTAAAP